MGRVGRVIVAVVMGLPWAALAQGAASGELSWQCEQLFDELFHVHCVPRHADDGERRVTPVAGAANQASGSAGLRRDLRPVAHRGDTEVFAMPAWRVPLYALPLDAAFTVELLRAVLCGRVTACDVHYTLPELRSARTMRGSVANRRR